MRTLVLFDYPPIPTGLSMQGDMLHRGMKDNGEEAMSCNLTGGLQKQWLYNLFKPDIAIGVGHWGDVPDVVIHPQKFGVSPVPWFVADGWVANYHELLSSLPLAFITSEWVKGTYARDGVDVKNFVIAHIGVEPDIYKPIPKTDPKVKLVRKMLGVADDEVMILTIGGDVTSKGAQEMFKALKIVKRDFRNWKYVCKIWGGGSALDHRADELRLIGELGDAQDRVIYQQGSFSRDFLPYLLNACDIYAAPSRLDGYGMIQVEAQACGIPVISINEMGPKETIVHGKTGFLARVAETVDLTEEWVYEDMGFEKKHKKKFDRPKTFAYRADVGELADYLMRLLAHPKLREEMGRAGHAHALLNFEYHKLAKEMTKIVKERLKLS